jgi:glycylpeptide N-tetradecanoyltransferase
VVVPKPIATATYWHRSLNPKKLVEIGFNALPPKMPMARYVKLHKVPKADDLNIIGSVREMQAKDANKIHALLNEYLKKFEIKLHFSKKDVTHFFLPRPDVVFTFVIEDDKKEITDFFSFYSLPSTILKQGTGYDKVNVRYHLILLTIIDCLCLLQCNYH